MIQPSQAGCIISHGYFCGKKHATFSLPIFHKQDTLLTAVTIRMYFPYSLGPAPYLFYGGAPPLSHTPRLTRDRWNLFLAEIVYL